MFNDDCLLLLRNAIIERAVDDYKSCVMGDCTAARNLYEIEAFFKSDYCGVLLGNTTTTGPEILEMLREWRRQVEEARRKGKRPYRLRI